MASRYAVLHKLEELMAAGDVARSAFVETIARLEAIGVPNHTLVTVMLTQMLPRMVHQNGPQWTAATLAKLACDISAGASPAGMTQ
jgi:hypothetical protein